MTDLELYKKLYATVCIAADRAIDLLSTPETVLMAKTLLEQALLSAENLYVNASDDAPL